MEELPPPWLKHPEISAGSIGWRMGYGEDYMDQFDRWFATLGSGDRDEYRIHYPEPDGWYGFYARGRGSE